MYLMIKSLFYGTPNLCFTVKLNQRTKGNQKRMNKWLNKRNLIIGLALLIFTGILIKTSWIGDDAYITFRTIENFINGYGLVFNIGERVQTYTHPLWFFLISGIQFVALKIFGLSYWNQLFFIAAGVSILLSVISISIFGFGIVKHAKTAFFAVTTLIFSKAFMDFSTSGLENPLTHLLLVIFLFIFIKSDEGSSSRLLKLTFIAGMAALNRLDTILFFLPPLLFELLNQSKKGKAIGTIIIGFLPLIIWEIFSLFYYGFLFPNTAYAKLNTGISKFDLFAQGVNYYLNSIRIDPITLFVIISAILLSFFQKKKRQLPIATGIFFYLIYILYIGGDFMSGRYFAAPFLVAVVMLSMYIPIRNRIFAGGYVILLIFSLLLPTSPVRSPINYTQGLEFRSFLDKNKIVDERGVYYERMGLLKDDRERSYPGSKFGGNNWRLKEKPIELILVGPLGVHAYQLGPNFHVIDKNGLTDPLMARLPVENINQWRIGHFRHIIPDGYIETLSSGENVIDDKNLATYYDRLSLIIHGRLFDWNRIITIWNINRGKYNFLIERYWENLR